jgi:hypothetical protein
MDDEVELDDARRIWGVAADLASAMTGLPRSAESMVELGFTQVLDVGGIIEPDGCYNLAGSPVLRRIDFRPAVFGDLHTILFEALDHDLSAKPLLAELQDEIRMFDEFVAIDGATSAEDLDVPVLGTFRELAHQIENSPGEFPEWDGRPLLLDEQKALLGYLSLIAAAEIVADSLCDEPLGEYLLRASGVVRTSEITGSDVLELNLVPGVLLRKPVMLICHEAGDAVLTALRRIPRHSNPLDVLQAVEIAVRSSVGVDVAAALQPTRDAVVRPFVFPQLLSSVGSDPTHEEANQPVD